MDAHKNGRSMLGLLEFKDGLLIQLVLPHQVTRKNILWSAAVASLLQVIHICCLNSATTKSPTTSIVANFFQVAHICCLDSAPTKTNHINTWAKIMKCSFPNAQPCPPSLRYNAHSSDDCVSQLSSYSSCRGRC
jgi:hypothetical protein